MAVELHKDSVIELSCGKSRIKVSTRGAEIVSFTGNDGIENIWQGEPDVWSGHAPVLFPVCCRAKDDSVVIDGVTYPMKKHGIALDAHFEPVSVTDNSLELLMENTEEMKSMYPVDYAFSVHFKVFENGYECSFITENRGESTIPFCVGGHPAFICGEEAANEHLEDYEIHFPIEENGMVATLNDRGEIIGQQLIPKLAGSSFKLSHSYFDNMDTIIFTELKSRELRLTGSKTGRGIQFSFEDMPVLAVWSKPGARADYVCLEPWQGLPAAVWESPELAQKPHAILLGPGQRHKTGYRVELIRP